jgi:hypothetical protein
MYICVCTLGHCYQFLKTRTSTASAALPHRLPLATIWHRRRAAKRATRRVTRDWQTAATLEMQAGRDDRLFPRFGEWMSEWVKGRSVYCFPTSHSTPPYPSVPRYWLIGSFEDLFNFCWKKFSWKTVFMEDYFIYNLCSMLSMWSILD